MSKEIKRKKTQWLVGEWGARDRPHDIGPDSNQCIRMARARVDQQEERTMCAVCMETKRSITLRPCGHTLPNTTWPSCVCPELLTLLKAQVRIWPLPPGLRLHRSCEIDLLEKFRDACTINDLGRTVRLRSRSRSSRSERSSTSSRSESVVHFVDVNEE